MSGLLRVVRFNWPRYAAAIAAITLAVIAPDVVMPAVPLRLGAGLAAAWLAVGLLATWWVYDRTPLYGWVWATGLLSAAPVRYAVLSTGLDEVSPTLRRLFPAARVELLDLFDPLVTREGSIRRARALAPPPAAARPARADRLPLPPGTLDAVFVVFAAHELRTADQRRALFGEISRVLRPGGELLLVEHCRGLANIAAYGPGAWHFYPRGEWLRLAGGAGLTLTGERTMTPLIRALAYRR